MKSIMKASFYQMRREKVIYIAPVIILGLSALTILMAHMGGSVGNGTGVVSGDEYVANGFGALLQIQLMMYVVIVGTVCAGDFSDKTSFYEVMSGHRRRDVFWGRVIPAIMISMFLSVLITGTELGLIYMLQGWEGRMNFFEVVMRNVLMLFPLCRILCELICVAFLVREKWLVIGIGMFIYIISSVLPSFVQDSASVILGITNIQLLSDYESWMTYNVVDGIEMVTVYDSSISFGMAAGTIAASVAAGAFFLFLGYHFFEKDDM